MSEPAVFVVKRDGQQRFYYDRWAHVNLYRNLVWGPDALDQWLAQETDSEVDEWSDEVDGGVVVDHDNKRMVWCGDDEPFEIPRTSQVLDRLLVAAWPGYEIEQAARGVIDLAVAAGQDFDPDEEYEYNTYDDRPQTIREGIGQYGDEEDDDEDEEEDWLDEDSTRAWVTLIDESGAVRHRQLSELSQDLIGGSASLIKQLGALEACEVPAEKVTSEGIWFDLGKMEIGLWGGVSARSSLEKLTQSWPDWRVFWAEQGYADQCSVSGPSGIPMTDAEALGKFVPVILSTKRIDMLNIMGALGGQLRKTAIKATGCLVIVLSFPVLLFGLISGNLKAAGITIGILVLIVAISFKVIEVRMKRKFKSGPLADEEDNSENADQRAPVAGPLDESERKQALDSLLASAGLPPLGEVEPYFEEDELLEGML